MDKSARPRKLVLCFDGTGNKFHGDDSDSNILKIFRMLDRSSANQYHYYQPGIGTYVTSNSLSHTGVVARISSQYKKAKDSAIGSTFDHHVVSGYRFLMRYYQTGDDIYMFGFSRGAYIVRFLAEMLDYVGLLSHGNEEMIRFAWKAFSQWQRRRKAGDDDNDDNDNDDDADDANQDASSSSSDDKRDSMYAFMKNFRETFSRPVGRIRFLGLFDTVNSVSRFESAWMQQHTRFPYTARSSARVVRHAVSIDERRAKFRQDLLYQKSPRAKPEHEHHHHHLSHIVSGSIRRSIDFYHQHAGSREDGVDGVGGVSPQAEHDAASSRQTLSIVVDGADDQLEYPERQRQPSRGRAFLDPSDAAAPAAKSSPRRKSRSRSRGQHARYRIPASSSSATAAAARGAQDQGTGACSAASSDCCDDDDDDEQDIDEVWFAGGHGDIGGGWPVPGDDRRSASHVPLTWMVREATRAGLAFDLEKLKAMGCWSDHHDPRRDGSGPLQVTIEAPDDDDDDADNGTAKSPQESRPHRHHPAFVDAMHRSHTSRLHDSLVYGDGLGALAVTAWRVMEWLPFRRMDLRQDGSWRPIRWPLPRGEVRDVPPGVRVHGSVLRRLRSDSSYRPGNLIVGGGGRGLRRAPEEYGIGEWKCVAEEGDPVGEIWMRK